MSCGRYLHYPNCIQVTTQRHKKVDSLGAACAVNWIIQKLEALLHSLPEPPPTEQPPRAAANRATSQSCRQQSNLPELRQQSNLSELPSNRATSQTCRQQSNLPELPPTEQPPRAAANRATSQSCRQTEQPPRATSQSCRQHSNFPELPPTAKLSLYNGSKFVYFYTHWQFSYYMQGNASNN